MYQVTWTIDVEASSPREAALYVWRHIFNRDEPQPDDACVFEVAAPFEAGARVDLAEEA
jgi:hypothetical protein